MAGVDHSLGIGSVRFWGVTPHCDLLLENGLVGADGKRCGGGDAHVLVLDPGDPRHLFATVAAHAERADGTHLHLYLHETHPETLARSVMLWSLACDASQGLTPQERAELVLEVHANAKLRPKTEALLAERAKAVREFVADDVPCAGLTPHVDLSLLRRKDRDRIDEAMALWSTKHPFDIETLRDQRQRTYFGTRYDARTNMYDWDHAMKLAKHAPIIHTVHYKYWRETGIAHTVRESSYTAPNRTLRASIVARFQGRTREGSGFFGDIVTSPHIAFGIACDDASFFERRSEQFVRNSCDIAEHNVASFVHRIQHGTAFPGLDAVVAAKADGAEGDGGGNGEGEGDGDAAGGEKGKSGEPKDDDGQKAGETTETTKGTGEAKEAESSPAAAQYTIHLLGFQEDPVKWMAGKRKYQDLFDAVYVSSSAPGNAITEIGPCLRPEASRAICDQINFMLDIKPEQHEQYSKALTEKMVENGWVPAKPGGSDENITKHYLYYAHA